MLSLYIFIDSQNEFKKNYKLVQGQFRLISTNNFVDLGYFRVVFAPV